MSENLDWPALVEWLNLDGMAGMAARHTHLLEYERPPENCLWLWVSNEHRMYGHNSYADKLQAALRPVLGSDLVVVIMVGKLLRYRWPATTEKAQQKAMLQMQMDQMQRAYAEHKRNA